MQSADEALLKWRGVHDGRAVWERWQDAEPIVDLVKEISTERHGTDFGRMTSLVPNVIYERWLREEWERGNIGLKPYSREMDEVVKRKLQDPDWRAFRCDNPSNPFYVGWTK